MDRLVNIFNAQRQLMIKYDPIEAQNGALFTAEVPVDIQSREGQMRLKDFFWRITEELGEVFDASVMHGPTSGEVAEELSDVLHFFAETFILAGADPLVVATQAMADQVRPIPLLGDTLDVLLSIADPEQASPRVTLAPHLWKIVAYLAMASNMLKARPWKQTYVQTDTVAFTNQLVYAFLELLLILKMLGFDGNGIEQLYFNKNAKNHNRVKENY